MNELRLVCEVCDRVTTLDSANARHIVAELERQGPSASHTWQCRCGLFTVTLRLPRRTHSACCPICLPMRGAA